MDLPVPREPVEIRDFIKRVRVALGNGDIEWDPQAVWAFNKLPEYLWSQWGSELKKQGITWQRFLRILSRRTEDMVDWALRGSLTWEELVERIKSSIEKYSSSIAQRPG